MSINRKHISVFEHQTIKLNQVIDGVKFDEPKLKAFERYFGEKGVPYFSLIHNGVRFNEYVGVIQVGDTVIEVLPKADNTFAGNHEKKHWRDILIDMLFAVGIFDIQTPSSTALRLKSNSILDLYFELFVNEVEYLFHNGLVKKYKWKEGNVTALKGSLQFGKQIQQNITHQERFYVRHISYDTEHLLHIVLYKTIQLLKQINTSSALHSRIGALLLNFPEMPDLKVTETIFDRISYDRKTQSYKKSIEIGRLLLLQYHPDLSKGQNHVLALMFDMNKLWEQFVLVSLRRNRQSNVTITAQTSKHFWKPEHGYRSSIRPDILIKNENGNCIVLDTKWKNLNGYNPSPDDLRQMYVYHEYYAAKKVALVYPGSESIETKGAFFPTPSYGQMDKVCSVIALALPVNARENKSLVRTWQENIQQRFECWIGQ